MKTSLVQNTKTQEHLTQRVWNGLKAIQKDAPVVKLLFKRMGVAII